MRSDGPPSIEDLATIRDFEAFMKGGSACLFCMCPTQHCDEERCCPRCVHGHLVQVEGPAVNGYAARPTIVVLDQ